MPCVNSRRLAHFILSHIHRCRHLSRAWLHALRARAFIRAGIPRRIFRFARCMHTPWSFSHWVCVPTAESVTPLFRWKPISGVGAGAVPSPAGGIPSARVVAGVGDGDLCSGLILGAELTCGRNGFKTWGEFPCGWIGLILGAEFI